MEMADAACVDTWPTAADVTPKTSSDATARPAKGRTSFIVNCLPTRFDGPDVGWRATSSNEPDQRTISPPSRLRKNSAQRHRQAAPDRADHPDEWIGAPLGQSPARFEIFVWRTLARELRAEAQS